VKYALALLMLAGCRGPDGMTIGATHYNMDGSKSTSAGPLGAGRASSESGGDGNSVEVSMHVPIGENPLERLAKALEDQNRRAALLAEDARLKAEEAESEKVAMARAQFNRPLPEDPVTTEHAPQPPEPADAEPPKPTQEESFPRWVKLTVIACTVVGAVLGVLARLGKLPFWKHDDHES
jgi:hypothetical protein